MPIRRRLDSLIREMSAVRDEMLALEGEILPEFRIHSTFAESARNLVHYLALRRRDLRDLQTELASLGVSSLGRAEPHVLGNMNAVLRLLEMATGHAPGPEPDDRAISLLEGRAFLDAHVHDLLGRPRVDRDVRIMVTLPSEAADDRELMRDLIKAGMDCVRINCAHDDPAVWSRMIDNLRSVERETGVVHPVAMDLAGPKLRTGPVLPGPAVVKVSPKRDEFGCVLSPATVWLVSEDGPPCAPPSGVQVALPVRSDFLERLCTGDEIRFDDARGRSRKLTVGESAGEGRTASCDRTAYFTTDVVLRHADDRTSIARLPLRLGVIRLELGDTLVITKGTEPGACAERDANGHVIRPAHISCSIPNVFEHVQPGDRVFLDDGRIGGIVRSVETNAFALEVTRARIGGEKLAADKGINLPDTNLGLPALTAKDFEDLEFVATHADIVNYSFVNEPSDVEALTHWLEAHDAGHLGVILKIETKRAFENLPGLLLAAMRSPRRGIMIARGDLAVECGFERMAEVQEEILWLCEAAHIPVVWATQVLETLAKEGAPSRAEITDAAFSNRAECVMLNKGPYIARAVAVLDDILCRMADHQNKKNPILGRLNVVRRVAVHSGPRSCGASDQPERSQ